jgi:glycosyltransferase involved in cell wall biosynthesis
MKKKILISVIIPIFNRQNYIARCLRSLLYQSFDRDSYEIIVINDGSTDNTSNILNAFNDEIIILKHRFNRGLPNALNKGIKASKGKYVVRVDSDDYVNSDYLKILYLFINNNKNFDAAACDYWTVDKNEKVIKRNNCIKNPIGCGIIFKKKDLMRIGLYNIKCKINEEVELRKRFEKKFKIHRISLPLYRYKQHDTNMTKK